MSTVPVARKKDIKIGLVSAVLGLALIILLLLFLSFEVADPKPEPPKVVATTDIEEIVLKDLKVDAGGGSEGSPSDDPVSEPQEQTQEVLTNNTNPTAKSTTGKATKPNTKTTKGTPSSTKKSNDPFGNGGSGEKGKGAGAFGDDDGKGSGEGPGGIGDGKGRKRLTSPNVDEIYSDQNHIIYLRIIMNAEGKVISATNFSSKTTTTDARIINKVIAAVIRDVRFSKKPGSDREKVTITININAN